MQDAKKIYIAKPVASRPFSNFRSFPNLLATHMTSSPSSSSAPEKTIAIRPKTIRFKPSPNDSAAKLVSATAPHDVSESVASHLSERVSVASLGADSKSNVLYKPTAKVVSSATASLLANLGNFVATHQQTATNNKHWPVRVLEQANSSYDYQPTVCHQLNSPSQCDIKQMYEPSNLVPQSMEVDMRNQQPGTAANADGPSYDGYKWRKYGQKQVKGSEYPRSYYKCTHTTCPVKKKVERSFDGQIAEIVYSGEHNHPKPQRPPRRISSASHVSNEHGRETGNNIPSSWSNSLFEANVSAAASMDNNNEVISLCGIPTYARQLHFSHDPTTTTHDNSACTQVSKFGSRSKTASMDHDKVDCKRRKNVDQVTGANSVGEGAAEPRSARHTSMESDISGDGYHWKKYGQKVVKGNTYPRSYYRCTSPKCKVRKYVERSSNESGCFVTTYEGKHNHEMPASKMNFVDPDPLQQPPLTTPVIT